MIQGGRSPCWRRAIATFALLFVVGEERNSAGAYKASAKYPRGSRYIINGEPTENQLGARLQGRATL